LPWSEWQLQDGEEVTLNEDLARHVAQVAFRASADLNDLLPLIREHATEQEYESFLVAISAISGDIAFKLLKRLYAAHPGMEAEFDERIARYGVLISN
jgi:hypothetical protein